MKKIIALLIMFVIYNLQAQEIEYFQDIQNTDFSRNTSVNFSYDTIMDFSAQSKLTFKIFIHDTSYNLGECNYLKGVKYLNNQYNQFNIYFKYMGYDQDNSNTHSDMIDIVLISGSGGHAYSIDNCQIGSICFDFDSPFVHTSTIAHEITHLFGVNHTFTGTYSTPLQVLTNPVSCPSTGGTVTSAHFATTTNFSENVTRDDSDPNYNARDTGDQITDTPATQQTPNLCIDYINDAITFLNISEVVDAVGQTYVDPNNTCTLNIMSYTPSKYRNSFTNGQGVRMRELAPNNSCQPTLCDVNELYKPYYAVAEIDMDDNHIISIEDDINNPGHLIVCRPQNLIHKFQIGFEYHIYKVNNGYYSNGDIVNPDDVSLQVIIPADTDCATTIQGTRLAVKIPALSDEIIMFEDIVCVMPYCSSEQITNTTIFSTDNYGSNNGTIKVLNAQESANPDLENNLEHQKYHIINKTTDTGIQKNKTIYKN